MRTNNKSINWIEFGFNLSSSLFFLMTGILVISSMSLYTAKVAASGALSGSPPTNVFTNVINETSGFPPKAGKTYKMEIGFDTTPTFSEQPWVKKIENFIINELSILPIIYYLFKIIIDVIEMHITVIEKVYTQVNKLPESVIMCLFLFLSPIFWFIMFFVNFIIIGVHHVINIKHAFTDPSKKGNEPSWINPIYWCVFIFYSIFMMFPFQIFEIGPLIMLCSYFYPLFVTGYSVKNSRSYNFFTSIVDMCMYKRQVILWLISLTFLRCVIMNLDIYNAVGCGIAIIGLAAFSNIYSQYMPPCLTKTD